MLSAVSGVLAGGLGLHQCATSPSATGLNGLIGAMIALAGAVVPYVVLRSIEAAARYKE